MTIKLIKLREVMALTSLGRSTIYKYIAEGAFPKQFKVLGNRVAWDYEEVQNWISTKIAERDNTPTV